MIIVGYQGIGKSTLAGRNNMFIDLESGNFWVDGKRADDWYKTYCKIAEHLSQQGYIVFTSSHEVVRKQLANSDEIVIAIYPSIELKDEWIARLEKRYSESGLEKDYKALMNAKDRYEENINELNESMKYQICPAPITDINYDLESFIVRVKNTINGFGC